MTVKLTHLAQQELEDIRTYTVEQWGRAQWFVYYRGLVAVFEAIKANPMSGRSRDLFRNGMRSVNYGRHIILFSPIAAAGDTPVVLRILHQRRHLPAMVYYDDLDGVWGTVNLFHRALARTERQLDDNEQAQRRLQREQDGSEVKSLELERLLAEGQSMLECRAALELFRDLAAEGFEHHLAKPWHPRSGSRVSHRNLTAAMIDSRDFLAARRRAEAQLLLPEGPKVAVTGGADFNDHHLIWARLDRVHAKHSDMVLLHGGSPKGTELIASRWADHRKVTQVAFRPDWAKNGRSAPFKRNDAMLDVLPIGVLVFPGTGIQENLADKARKLGIPVLKHEGGA